MTISTLSRILRATMILLMLSTLGIYAYVDPISIITQNTKHHDMPRLSTTNSSFSHENSKSILARVTYYYRGEDHYTAKGETSTGLPLHQGVCAVDPKRIPFFARVHLQGIGTYEALDSGTAVVNRRAARLSARTKEERNAIVVDIYCSSRSEAHRMEQENPLYVVVEWD